MKLFPFTQEGRQTLVYLVFAGSGPVLTAFTAWAMYEALRQGWEATFANLAYTVAACLLIIVTGLAMFVSIRAVRLGKDGFSAEGGDKAVGAQLATEAATQAGQAVVEELKP
jgi:zinc transporter ZupT